MGPIWILLGLIGLVIVVPTLWLFINFVLPILVILVVSGFLIIVVISLLFGRPNRDQA